MTAASDVEVKGGEDVVGSVPESLGDDSRATGARTA